jgi:Protein of unknown function (DUF4233)
MSDADDGTGSAGPDQSRPDIGGAGSGGGPQDRPPSGLRNPGASVRGAGAAALAAEGLALLLGIVPLRVIGASGTGGTVAIAALALVSFALAGLLRHRWAWWAASAVPLAIIACGFLVHLALSAVGVLFGLLWLYVLRVRVTVLGRGPHASG